MATVEKIRRDIEKTKEKISEQQKRLRSLEAQLVEEENLEIIRLFTAALAVALCATAFAVPAFAGGGEGEPYTTPKRRLTSRRMTEPRKSRFPMMKILPAAIMRRPAVTPWTSSPNCWAAWEP